MIELAASILSADFSRLGEETRSAVAGGTTLLHLDVDGHFVPNIAIGPAVVASLRSCPGNSGNIDYSALQGDRNRVSAIVCAEL